MRVAIVEDDTHVGQLMCLWLEEAGHSSQHCLSGKPFLQVMARESFDLVILDWMLPDTSGDQLLAWLRANVDWQIPVIFVTSRDTEEDIVHGLNLGADDYITKPVRRNEFLARLGAVLRRTAPAPAKDELLDLPPFRIDTAARRIARDGQDIDLTQKEYELALFLFRNPGRLLSRRHLLESVWGHQSEINTRTVDTHISRLRTKMALLPEQGWRLSAVYNHGYRLERLNET
jgi:DNA-binding response OmpR family regulator